MWSVFARGKHPSARRIALAVAAIFAIAGVAWVMITDILLYQLTQDRVLVARIETAKGGAFVVMATLLLYFVTYRSALRLSRAQRGVTAVVESIADGVLLLGPDRRIRRANPAAVQMLGAEDLVGMGAEEFARRFRVSRLDGSLVPPGDYVSQRVFDEGGPLKYKAILYPQCGSPLIVSVTAAAVRVYADESPDMVVSVMHDITDPEHLARLRDQFLAAAAHSLKTPVAIVKANVQVLRSGDEAHSAEAAAAIGQQCDRMDLLVQNLFALARIRTNSLQLYPDEVDLPPLVERVTAAVAAAEKRRVDSEFLVRPCPRVHADAERMTLALRNLLDEALRLSAPAEPVTVLLARQGRDVEIGIRHHVRSPSGQASLAGEQDELEIHHLVTSTIVAAHGGGMRHDAAGREATAWISLPTIETCA